jgi:hypothetical protein
MNFFFFFVKFIVLVKYVWFIVKLDGNAVNITYSHSKNTYKYHFFTIYIIFVLTKFFITSQNYIGIKENLIKS